MSKHVKSMEKEIKTNPSGQTSKIVDYIMYISIVFVIVFGLVAYKKLQDQKSTLVLWAYNNALNIFPIFDKKKFNYK